MNVLLFFAYVIATSFGLGYLPYGRTLAASLLGVAFFAWLGPVLPVLEGWSLVRQQMALGLKFGVIYAVLLLAVTAVRMHTRKKVLSFEMCHYTIAAHVLCAQIWSRFPQWQVVLPVVGVWYLAVLFLEAATERWKVLQSKNDLWTWHTPFGGVRGRVLYLALVIGGLCTFVVPIIVCLRVL